MNKDLDFDAMYAELDAEFADEEVNPEVQDEEAVTEVTEDFSDDEYAEEEETPEEINDDDIHKRNAAFKELREERDRLAKSDAFLQNLANQYGITVDELMNNYQQELDRRQAEEQGVDPVQFQRMKEMEEKLAAIEEQKSREVFNLRAQQLVERHKLSEQDMVLLFTEAAKMGVDITSNPELLEFTYRSVFFDRAQEMGRQKVLETSKKRKSTSAGQTGLKGSQPTVNQEADWEKEIEEFLKKEKII